MEYIASTSCVIIGVATPIAAIIAMSLKNHHQYWPIYLIGSAIFSYLMILVYIGVYAAELDYIYAITRDPAIRRRITSDAGNGIAIVFGWVGTLAWAIFIFIPTALIRLTVIKIRNSRMA